MMRRLLLVDDALAVAGGLCLVLILGRWLTGGRRDPFALSPRRPNRLLAESVALATVAYLMVGLMGTGLASWLADEPEGLRVRALIGGGAHVAGIIICLCVAKWHFDGGVRRFWIADGAGRGVMGLSLAAAVIALGLCPLIANATGSGIRYFFPGYEFAAHPTIQVLHGAKEPIEFVVLYWLGAVVAAPIAEEFFFRGLLQTMLVGTFDIIRRRRAAVFEGPLLGPSDDTGAITGDDDTLRGAEPAAQFASSSRWLAIIMVSVAFGAVHMGQPAAVVALAVFGALLGYLYERTGSMIAPILVHAAFNLKTLIWDALIGGGA